MKKQLRGFSMGKIPIFHLIKKAFFSKTSKSLLGGTCWNYSGKCRFPWKITFSQKFDFPWEKLACWTAFHICKRLCPKAAGAWRGTERKAKPTSVVKGTGVSSTKCRTPSLTAVLLGHHGDSVVYQQRPGTNETSLMNGDAGQKQQSVEMRPFPTLPWPAGSTQCHFHLPTAEMIVSVPIGTCLSQWEI